MSLFNIKVLLLLAIKHRTILLRISIQGPFMFFLVKHNRSLNFINIPPGSWQTPLLHTFPTAQVSPLHLHSIVKILPSGHSQEKKNTTYPIEYLWRNCETWCISMTQIYFFPLLFVFVFFWRRWDKKYIFQNKNFFFTFFFNF